MTTYNHTNGNQYTILSVKNGNALLVSNKGQYVIAKRYSIIDNYITWAWGGYFFDEDKAIKSFYSI